MPYWEKIYGGWVLRDDNDEAIGFGDPASGLDTVMQPYVERVNNGEIKDHAGNVIGWEGEDTEPDDQENDEGYRTPPRPPAGPSL